MNLDTKATWERYVSSWKATSLEEKTRIFQGCLSADCVYTDPLAQTEGWDALSAYMASFHEQVPGGHFVTTYFLAHHDKSIARWNMVAGDGTPIGEGISYGEYNADGKLVAMTGFFESP